MKDEEFILRFKEKFKLEENLAVIFTDASKIENNPSAGIDIVISGKDEAFSLSRQPLLHIYGGAYSGGKSSWIYSRQRMDE